MATIGDAAGADTLVAAGTPFTNRMRKIAAPGSFRLLLIESCAQLPAAQTRSSG